MLTYISRFIFYTNMHFSCSCLNVSMPTLLFFSVLADFAVSRVSWLLLYTFGVCYVSVPVKGLISFWANYPTDCEPSRLFGHLLLTVIPAYWFKNKSFCNLYPSSRNPGVLLCHFGMDVLLHFHKVGEHSRDKLKTARSKVVVV